MHALPLRRLLLSVTALAWGVAVAWICTEPPSAAQDTRSHQQYDPAVVTVSHEDAIPWPDAKPFQPLPAVLPEKVTPAERATLATLPPVCVSGLPGIDPRPLGAHPLGTLVSPENAKIKHDQAGGVLEAFAPPVAPPQPLPSAGSQLISLGGSAPHASGPSAVAPHSIAPHSIAPHSIAPHSIAPHSIATHASAPHSVSAAAQPLVRVPLATDDPCIDPHLEVFANNPYPSALECRKCHQRIYDEWAVSSHANASLSPMFHKFEQKLNELAQGTLGYFCYRCHAPVATTMNFPREAAIYEGPRVYREGVTCVACHRVAESYAKVNGERRMEPGPVEAPVYGTSNGDAAETVLKYRDHYKVKTDSAANTPGTVMHRRVIQFEEISNSTFCVSCHQVAVHPGIKLEVVWEQYRNSPAYRQGTRCHDCHMGKTPGLPEGFEVDYVAKVNEKPVGAERRHSNHLFFGPGAAITHPGLFPHHPDADRFTPRAWLEFDWRAGWGTEAFEQEVERSARADCFPPAWAESDDRRDAREILTANLQRLAWKDATRSAVMENGSHIAGPYFAAATRRADGTLAAGRDLHLRYVVANRNPGHNMPTGSLGAQPQLWLNVALVNPAGQITWESGYLDSQGDLADNHSVAVHRKQVPFDRQLVNYQTKFLITNLKGTDREMPLPVNIDLDQIPFLRPAPQPVSVMNHPPLIRMEAHSIAPLGTRDANYVIPGEALCQPGTYRLSIRMRSRGEPIYFMKFVESTPEMIGRMNEKILDIHRQTITFEVR